jgi:hypothetical protein
MGPIRTALLSTTPSVRVAEAHVIAAALQKQLSDDFEPIWGIPATIETFARPEEVPQDYWVMTIQDGLSRSGLGFHHLDHGRPVAFVSSRQPPELIAHTCSHELLEMLVDPRGDRLSQGSIPPPDPNLPPPLTPETAVQYLLEICDPCQSKWFAYRIDGVVVCNFCRPAYYSADQEIQPRFFKGAPGLARLILNGGYASFRSKAMRTQWWRTERFGSCLETGPESAVFPF